MRRLVRSCLAASVLLAACDVSSPEESASEGIAAAAAALELPPTIGEACLDDRYVGLTTTGVCPSTTGNADGFWKPSKAFVGATAPTLKNYCVYEWSPSNVTAPAAPDPTLLPALGAISWSTWLAPDCHVSAPLSELEDARRKIRTELVAERDAHLGLTGARTKGPREKVRVAVIDTSPTSPGRIPVLGANAHGHDVARVIEDIACGDNAAVTCPTEIETELGLPLVAPKRADRDNGGWFGTQLDVAQAIYRAVEAWRSEDPKKRPKHLVLNLSLGWQGELGGPIAAGSDERSLRAPVRSAYDALRYASCSDALVIVAAGNDPGGPTRSAGAMYPAGWEQQPAPSPGTCETSFGKGIEPADGGDYRPLVHAVAAVSSQDVPTATNRLFGRPRLVAPGAQIVARLEEGTVISAPGVPDAPLPNRRFTAPRTGSSMSAATTSGAAALLWSMRPELTPHQVMDAIWKTGAPTGSAADFALQGTTPETSRLDVCELARYACVSPGVCDEAPTCTSRPHRSGRYFAMSDGAIAELDGAFSSAPLLPLTLDLAVEHHADRCGAHAIALGGRGDDEPCVDRTYFGEASVPFALPQPSGNGDPEVWGRVVNPAILTGNPPSKFDVFIDRLEARDYDLENTTLVLTFGRDRVTYPLDVIVPAGDGDLQLRFSTRSVTRDGLTDATLAFTVAGLRTTVLTSPMTLAFVTE